MSAALDLIYVAGLSIAGPILGVSALRKGRSPDGIGERFGVLPFRRARREPGARLLWIHAVSVGEVNIARAFASAFLEENPGWELAVSTGTGTGRERARRVFPDDRVFYFPLDLGPCVRSSWGRVRPDLVVLVELEVWPNFMETARAARVPVVVVNGRITERTARRYRMFGGIFGRAFAALARVCAQNEEYAARFRTVGVPAERIAVTGNVKYDMSTASATAAAAEADSPDADRWAELAAASGIATDGRAAPVLVAGSTGSPEERVVLELARRLRAGPVPHLRVIVVPRHVERGEEVASVCRDVGLTPVRRSARPASTAPADAVLVLDTIGELVAAYEAADVVFVGGSLNDRGGQNMLEPAGLGKPVVVGPNTRNFRESVGHLLAREGLIQARDAAGVGEALAGLLADPQGAAAMGRRARAAIDELRGATRRTVASLAPLVRAPAAA